MRDDIFITTAGSALMSVFALMLWPDYAEVSIGLVVVSIVMLAVALHLSQEEQKIIDQHRRHHPDE